MVTFLQSAAEKFLIVFKGCRALFRVDMGNSIIRDRKNVRDLNVKISTTSFHEKSNTQK